MFKFPVLLSLAVCCLTGEVLGQGPIAVVCGRLGGNWDCATAYPAGPQGIGGCDQTGTCDPVSNSCNDWVVYQTAGNQNAIYDSIVYDDPPVSGVNSELKPTLVLCQSEVYCQWECKQIQGIWRCQNSGYSIPWVGFDWADIGPCP